MCMNTSAICRDKTNELPVVLDAGVQGHVVDDADVGEGKQDFGRAA